MEQDSSLAQQETETKTTHPIGEARNPYALLLSARKHDLPWYRKHQDIIKLVMGFVCMLPLVAFILQSGMGAAAKQYAGGATPTPTPTPALQFVPAQGAPSLVQNPTPHPPVRRQAIANTPQTTQPKPVSKPGLSPTAVKPTSTPSSQENAQGNDDDDDLFVHFIAVYGVEDASAKASVHTLPGAKLKIRVMYCWGGRRDWSDSLQGWVYADSNGYYTWYWVPHTHCKGPAKAYVTARYGDREITAPGDFDVK